MTVYI